MKNNNTSEKAAMRVSAISMAANFVLSGFKLIAGILGNSGALVADAVHSASDVVSTIVVIVGIKISGKNPDTEHPYGHEKIECVAAVILSMMLAIVGAGIGKNALSKILSGSYKQETLPGVLALVAAIISIIVKELMFQYTMHVANRIKSTALKADAWHHRSDALSSIGSVIGVTGAMLGVSIADSIASVVICIFILKASVDIFIEGVNGLVDHACSPETIAKLEEVIKSESGVIRIDELKTRIFGSKMYVDAEISVDGNLSLRDAHEIAEKVHNRIEKEFDEVKHIMIHTNPY